jgi:hypothetical protein
MYLKKSGNIGPNRAVSFKGYDIFTYYLFTGFRQHGQNSS